jgi:hypothetical protein
VDEVTALVVLMLVRNAPARAPLVQELVQAVHGYPPGARDRAQGRRPSANAARQECHSVLMALVCQGRRLLVYVQPQEREDALVTQAAQEAAFVAATVFVRHLTLELSVHPRSSAQVQGGM